MEGNQVDEEQKNYYLCREGIISFLNYIGTMALVLVPTIPQIYLDAVPDARGAVLWGPLLYYILVNMIIRFCLRDYEYQIAVRASFLGFLQACSILCILFVEGVWKQFGVYVAFMAFFHYSEFFTIAWCNPRSLTTDSFMINHSWAYGLAAAASWLEFCLEVEFLPNFKEFAYLWLIGVALCIFGETVRKTAMITASSNFTHLVRFQKAEDHQLITHGIFAFVRHPSYVGWFWWSIGTQIVLFNPICIIVYTIISWLFFRDRIYCEEYTLLHFFTQDYKSYQKRVPTGFPFIKGFVLD